MSTAAMMVSFHPKRPQGHGSMTAGAEPGFANPVSPKRPRPDPAAAQLSPELIEATALAPEFHGALSSPHNTIATAVAVAPGDMTTTTTTAVVTSAKRSRRSSAVSTSRTCSTELYAPSDDLNEIRLTKVAKTTVSSSAAASASAMSTGRPSTTAAAAELSRIAGRTGKSIALSPPFVTQTRSQQGMTQPLSPPLQSIEPTTTTAAIDYTQRATAATTSAANNNSKARANVTHPRRAAQNRAAQRTFRNRRKAYIKDMEQKVLELHQTRARFDMLKNENQEIWRRYRILENLVISSSNGNNNNRQLDMPSFTPMTPFLETEAGLAAQAAQAAHAAQVAQAAAQAQATGAAMAGGRGGALNDAQYSSQSSELDDEGEGSPVPRSYQQPQRQ
ncbi:hypothetical protein BGX31_005827 [Mortierella sp. GBA43]|nr:hypothetical protein BGX31_005827 [Mortierella sp. GBA43]